MCIFNVNFSAEIYMHCWNINRSRRCVGGVLFMFTLYTLARTTMKSRKLRIVMLRRKPFDRNWKQRDHTNMACERVSKPWSTKNMLVWQYYSMDRLSSARQGDSGRYIKKWHSHARSLPTQSYDGIMTITVTRQRWRRWADDNLYDTVRKKT